MDIFSPEHLGSLADKLWDLAVVFVPRLLAAIVILAVALWLSSRVCRWVSRALGRAPHIDDTLKFLLAEFVRYATLLLAVVLALEQLGVRATSLLAVLGAAGLAVGLALQGTLSNIAAGLMLLWLRPFRIGDYIEVNNVPGLAGTVRQMGLFTCQLESYDGLFLFVPNSGLWNVPLRNYTRNDGRLISFIVTVPRGLDADRAREALLAVAAREPEIAKQPEPLAFIERVTADGVVLNFRFWAAPEHVGDLQRKMPAAARAAVAGLGKDEVPVQVVRVVPPDSDPSRLLRRYDPKSAT